MPRAAGARGCQGALGTWKAEVSLASPVALSTSPLVLLVVLGRLVPRLLALRAVLERYGAWAAEVNAQLRLAGLNLDEVHIVRVPWRREEGGQVV